MRTLPIPKDTTRTHVILPTEIVSEVDRVVGSRKRSQFIASAVDEKLARLRLLVASAKAAGSLRHVSIPEWDTAEKTSQWVAKGRAQADERFARQP